MIEGIGTVLSADHNVAHIGVQGMLMGGSNNDIWIASASLGYHNTNYGNVLAGVSSNVLDVGSYVVSQDLMTAVFSGSNENIGANHYGIYIREASNNYIDGNINIQGKMGINIGTRERATFLEINGQPYISANNAGIVMKSPNGSCWNVRVNDSGAVYTTSISCP